MGSKKFCVHQNLRFKILFGLNIFRCITGWFMRKNSSKIILQKKFWSKTTTMTTTIKTTTTVTTTRPCWSIARAQNGQFLSYRSWPYIKMTATAVYGRAESKSLAEYVQRPVCFAWKCRLFCLCAHEQCRVYYIYHAEFHFRFGHLITFPV